MLNLLSDLWNAVRYLRLLYPFLICAAILGAWKLPRGSRYRRLALASVLSLFTLSWYPVAWLNTYFLELPYREASSAPAVDAIVVLSGATAPPNSAFPYGVLLDSTVRRTRQAAYLAQKLPTTPVLTCGPRYAASPQYPSIAQEMGELLAGWGVDRDRIWFEEIGVSTASQTVEAGKVLRARGVRSILLVTDAFHMRRAAACFRKAGFETFAAPSHVYSSSDSPKLAYLLPSPTGVSMNEEAIREWMALALYKIRGVI